MSSKHNKNKRPGLPPPGYDVEAAALANGEEKSPLKKKPSKQHRDANATHRGRTFSSGSTLGAFYPLGETAAAAAAPKGLPKKRLSKRHSKHGQVPTQIPVADQQPPTFQNMGTGSDLGDVASMAIAGLGEDLNMSDLAGGPPTFSQSNQRFNGNVRAAPQAHNRRNGPSPPSSVPPLATIPDISENYSYATNDNVTPDYQRRINDPYNNMSPNSRRVMNEQFNMYGGVQRGLNKRGSVDSLRVSDVSLDDDAAKNFMSGLDREGSTYASADSFVVPNDADYGNSDRTSLVGTNLFDKRSSSSLKQQTPPYGRGTNNQMHANTWSSTHGDQLSALSENSNQNQEIASFSAMLHATYGSADAYGAGSSPQFVERKQHPPTSQGPPPRKSPKTVDQQRPSPKQMTYVGSSTEDELSDASLKEVADHRSRLLEWLDPTSWLTKDLKFDDGAPYFDDSDYWTIAGMVRSLFYNPVTPEFTSLQQFSWACLIGIFMGFYTAFWKTLIERSVDFMWKDVPETLLEWGLFTELDGAFPLYHYMWICPAIWGGILSYIFVIIPTPIPGQNEWIQNLHTIGVQSHDTFLILFVLSTLGMASGLSLGPELPLVLTSGMLGSMLAIQCKQSILQARVMNITAASAAIGGFFGFPMAGALFVLEIPHRMGLQYFEALSPATIASIVAVLCNRLVTGNDVTGYYEYPFLTSTLPSEIFTSAIVFGLFGAFLGTCYTKAVLKLKNLVHDFFHAPHDDHNHGGEENGQSDNASANDSMAEENTPLVVKQSTKQKKSVPPPQIPLHQKIAKLAQKYFCCIIPHEPYRAAAAGTVAGAMVGVICMFVPHVLFWGEAQLQTMIDKGRTPLPVFGKEDEPTAALTHLGYCMIDPKDGAAVRAGFGIGCSFLITTAKIVTTGLSLGTGIIGGHFWGPLFAGCVASHFLIDAFRLCDKTFGFGGSLAAYPCVAILCVMGSTHVVTFRAHMAIMLILTLTISAFDPEDGDNQSPGVAGDYSAVFPLLVISVFVSLMITRQTVFYSTQRSRGDIMALPEVLCEPGKEGMPMVLDYEPDDLMEDDDSDYSSDEGYQSDRDVVSPRRGFEKRGQSPYQEIVAQDAIEKDFNSMNSPVPPPAPPLPPQDTIRSERARATSRERANSQDSKSRSRGVSPLPPRPREKGKQTIHGDLPPSGPPSSIGADAGGSGDLGKLDSARLDELLAQPLDYQRPSTKARHRRIQSAPNANFNPRGGGKSNRFARARANSSFDNGEDSASNLGGSDAGSATGGGRGHLRSDSYGSQASGPLMRITSFGHLNDNKMQPSLTDQARLRSATSVIVESRHVRQGSMPIRLPRSRGHSRQNSSSSLLDASVGVPSGPPLSVAVAVADRNAVPASEVERAFSSAVNQQMVPGLHRSADGSNRYSPAPPE